MIYKHELYYLRVMKHSSKIPSQFRGTSMFSSLLYKNFPYSIPQVIIQSILKRVVTSDDDFQQNLFQQRR